MIYWPIHRHLSTVKAQVLAVFRFMPWSTCAIQPFLKINNRKTVNSNANMTITHRKPNNRFIFSSFAELQLNLIDSKNEYRRSTYIPVSSPLLQNSVWTKGGYTTEAKNETSKNASLSRDRRELPPVTPVNETNPAINATDAPTVATTINTTDENSTDDSVSGTVPSYDSEGASSQNTRTEQNYPTFHVTYWMFYPYSQVRREFPSNNSHSIS